MSFEYNTSLIYERRKGTEDDNYPYIQDIRILVQNTVLLSEIPDIHNHVHVVEPSTGDEFYEIFDNSELKNNQFRVDYNFGFVYFNNKNLNKELSFSYRGTGSVFIPVDRVWTKVDANGNVIETLGQITDGLDTMLDTIEDAKNTNESIKISESIRVSNEDSRTAAENIRVTNETNRITFENNRVSAENNRNSQESTRQTNETARQSNETDRASAENIRFTAESERKNAEINRAAAESNRVAAENIRKSNEDARISQENTRKSNEDTRMSQENIRKSTEDARISQENTRKSKEIDRQNAEIARQSGETDRIASENSRKTDENTRISNEVIRQTNEENRVSAENSRVSQENVRKTNEVARISRDNAFHVFEYYNETKLYVPLNKVSYNGSSFICISECTGKNPYDTAYWLQISNGYVWKGFYSSEISYYPNNLVTQGNSIYLCKQICLNKPVNNTDYWEIFVKPDLEIQTLVLENTNIINTDSSYVAIGIPEFLDSTDVIQVFAGSVYLKKGIDYTINSSSTYINKINGAWDAGTEFDFIVFKTVKNKITYFDGSLIIDGSITKSKLNEDLKNELNSMKIFIGNSTPTNGISFWIDTSV